MERQKIGLIIDSYNIELWKSIIIKDILKSGALISHIIILNKDKKNQSLLSLKILYKKIDYKFFKENVDSKKQVNSANELKDIKTYTATIKNKKISLLDSDKEEIKNERIDVCINLATAILIDSQIQVLYSQGVWQYEGIDEKGNMFIGEHSIVEFYSNSSINGLALVQVTTTTKNILSKGYSKTNPLSLYKTKNKLLLRSTSFVSDNLNQLNSLGGRKYQEHIQNKNSLIYNYGNQKRSINGLILFIKVGFRILSHIIKSKFTNEKWRLIYSFEDENKLSNFKVYNPSNGNECADPFIFTEGDEKYIFFENIDVNKLGSIHCISTKDLAANKNSTLVLEKDYHLSYPYVFKYENEFYMIPETKSNKTIEIFKAQQFPFKWEIHSTIFEAVEAVDSSLIFHNNKWWLFTNMARKKGAAASEELHIFYTDSPISKDWKPHGTNPQVSDIRYSRNGGRIINRGGRIYRVSQDCAVSYGFSVAFHEIIELTPTNYEERFVSEILPSWSKTVKGIHTVANEADIWVMDIKTKTKLALK